LVRTSLNAELVHSGIRKESSLLLQRRYVLKQNRVEGYALLIGDEGLLENSINVRRGDTSRDVCLLSTSVMEVIWTGSEQKVLN
jgi:hypothetical protein